MSTHVAQPGVPEPIRSKLGALRRAVRLWFWIDGLAALCVAALGLSLLSLLVDRTFRMDRTQRALCLAGALAALGVEEQEEESGERNEDEKKDEKK